jgi:FlaA1/EpsC-like NDP-sugar epimerase
MNPLEIVGISRNEFNSVSMERRLNNDKVKLIIGDVRDYEAVNSAIQGCDIVYHLSSLKHIDQIELNPDEAIKTNIIGTQNIIKASKENNVEKVIFSNTDKSVSPSSVYGCTKFICERLLIQANINSTTKFTSVRAGNVMGSNGSFIPYCIDLIKNKKPIPITDFRMTRFFLTLEEAIKLLLKASEISQGGEAFVVNMPACKIKDLAIVLNDYYGDKTENIIEVGKRPGEKLAELLISKHESPFTYKLDDNYFVILPTNDFEDLKLFYKNQNLKLVDFEEFSSDTKLMNFDEIKNMLDKGGFLK